MLFYGMKLQKGVTPYMNKLELMHDYLLFIGSGVAVLVSGLLYSVWGESSVSSLVLDYELLEIVWTVVPAFMLVSMALPSLTVLYSYDNLGFNDGMKVVKITGYQWYWHYEYNMQGKELSYDSFMLNEDSLGLGGFRKLEVDKVVLLPVKEPVRFLMTSKDVIHKWCVPSMGVKVDAIPGRINSQTSVMKSVGVYYGQCSELCGSNHSFMPMCVEVVKM